MSHFLQLNLNFNEFYQVNLKFSFISTIQLLGDPEVSANLYCNSRNLYCEGCAIIRGYLWNARYSHDRMDYGTNIGW